MRFFISIIYIIALLLLQSVIFPRLNLWGIYPDTILVAVVVFAVMAQRIPALLFAGALGFLQDIFSVGYYVNTVLKVIAGLIVANINEEFVGDRGRLALGLTAVVSPAALLIESLFYGCFLGAMIDPWFFLLKLFVQTAMNLLLVPVIYLLTENLVAHE